MCSNNNRLAVRWSCNVAVHHCLALRIRSVRSGYWTIKRSQCSDNITGITRVHTAPVIAGGTSGPAPAKSAVYLFIVTTAGCCKL